MHLLGGRYELGKKIASNYSAFSSEEIELHEGLDHLQNKRSVLIEVFTLPEGNEARRLAIALWEREIRLTRKAMASNGGTLLLPLLDASIDPNSDKLYIVFRRDGKSLEEWIENEEGLWFLEENNEESRKTVWKLLLSLINGIEALHQAKLLHRNINPSTIHYSSETDEECLKLSGFTWSLYLHNLNSIPEQLAKRKRKLSLFQPPESIDPKKDTSKFANIFAEDVFSLGMVILFIFSPDFPEHSPSKISEWTKQYNEVSNFIDSPSSPFNKLESSLLHRCISENPSERPRTINELRHEIQKVLESFEADGKVIKEQPKVNWFNQAESPFISNLSRITPYSIRAILENPNDWLQEDFKGAQVYVTGIEDYQLIVISNKEIAFNLRPAYIRSQNFRNKEVLNLSIIRTRDRQRVLRAIREKTPLAILENGLQFVSDRFTREPQSPWRRLLAKAQKELEDKLDRATEEDCFIDSLKVMLEAENKLDAEKMLQYMLVGRIRRDPRKKIESAKIRVSSDFGKEMKIGERQQALERIRQFESENGGKIELSSSNTPSSSWVHAREWFIRKIDGARLECLIERPLQKTSKSPDEMGVIRPFEMNPSLSVYRRKERLIESIDGNKVLLSAILNPKTTTFYLGLHQTTSHPVVPNILNTIPMFLVQGPPGTGKTWVASTIVAKILEENPYARILISSKDHNPLDHLVEAILDKIPRNLDPKPILIRVLNPEKEKEYTATEKVLEYTPVKQTRKILEDSTENILEVKILSSNLEEQWQDEIQENLANPSLRWMDEIKKAANVVFATTTSSTIEWLGKQAAPYDWVIVEEAAKAYPLELLLPMNLGYRWLLIGDQKQLPPYKYEEMAIAVSDILDEEQVRSDEDEETYHEFREDCLKNIKLFETLFDSFKNVEVLFSEEDYHPCTQLNNQWRLPPLVSDMISQIFYDTQFSSKQQAPLDGDPFSSPAFMETNQLIWIDIPHASTKKEFGERRTAEGSYYNAEEINSVIQLVEMLAIDEQKLTFADVNIVFLTAYSAQKERLSKRLASEKIPGFDAKKLARSCHTIDSYQGRQADIVVISLVRNNERDKAKSALGFLLKEERLNVMFSRVRKRLVIIGCSRQILRFKDDQETAKMVRVFEYFKEYGIIVKSAHLETLS